MKKNPFAAGAAACLAAVPVSLYAQTAPANGARPSTDDALSEVLVTATRSSEGTRTDLLGSSFTILTASDLEDRQVRIVSDVLRDVPGISVSRAGAVGGLTQIRMRGTEPNHALVLIDGIEASDPYAGEFDFATLIADDIAKVEVLRGQQSALYGSDAIGGVIHYITLTGEEAPGIRARFEGGSFGTADASARAAGVFGPLDYSLSAGYQSADGTPTSRFGVRDLSSENAAASAKLIYSVSDSARITGVVRFSRTEADVNDQAFMGPFTGYVVDSDDYYKNRALYALIRGEIDTLDGRWTHALSAQGVDANRKGFSGDSLDYGDDGARQRYSYVSTLRFGSEAFSSRFTAALDYEREEMQNRGPFLTPAQGQEQTTTNKGAVAQYDATLNDRIGLGAAVRYDDNDRFENDTTYRLQGSYLFDSGTRLHAAAGSGIKNPGFFELFGFDPDTFVGNPNLKPEKSQGWEFGVQQRFLEGRAQVDVTYFDSTLENEIAFQPLPGFLSTYRNLSTDSTQEGVEVAFSARIADAWKVDASYTYLDSEQDGVEEVRRPPHIASLNLSWRGLDARRLGLGLTVRYNGSTLDNDLRTFTVTRLDSFTLVNLDADYRITDTLQVYGRVENALNEDYEEIFTYRTPGTAAYAGVRLRF